MLVDARVVPQPEQVADAGELRLDIPNEWLLETIFALVTAGLRSRKRLGLTEDELVDALTDLLLRGLRV